MIKKLKLEIDEYENAAFLNGMDREETARILRSTADLIEAGKTPTRLLDVAGNTVGFIEIKEK